MGGALRGFVSGGIGLCVMYLVVTANGKQLQDAASLPGKFLHWLIDPSVALVPNVANYQAGSSSWTPNPAQPSSTTTSTPTGTKYA